MAAFFESSGLGRSRMHKWKLSLYTSIINDNDSGDILLHNSFFGAIARVPANRLESKEVLLRKAFDAHRNSSSAMELEEPNANQPMLSELCQQGFFVPSDLDERRLVSKIIDEEREASFGLIILPHENCNFRCLYCYETFERGEMNQAVVAALKALVRNKAKEIKRLSISWFGGEPLLARHLVYELSDSFMDSCHENGITYSANITTNGYLLTPAVVTALLQREVRHYQVTLDGPEACHNLKRKMASGAPTYRRILDNLIAMHHSESEFLVRIRVNYDNANAPFIEPFLREIGASFKGDPRFMLAFHPIGKWGGANDSILETCDATCAQTIRLDLMKTALELGFSDRLVKQTLMPHGTACYAGRESSLVVRSDGVICKCTVALEDPRNHVGKLTGDGEITTDRLLWDMWTTLNDRSAVKCVSCPFYPSCQGRACPLAGINAGEPVCPLTQANYESTVRLAASTGPEASDAAHR